MKFTKVFLREKKISKGRKSLYLDFYPPIINPETGKPTRREFLNLVVLERPRSSDETQENQNARMLAEQIRAKRQIEVQTSEAGLPSQVNRKADFIAYMRQIAAKRSGSNLEGWRSAIAHLENFAGGRVTMSEVTLRFCEDFQNYLKNEANIRTLATDENRRVKRRLSHNSAISYYTKFTATVKQAFRDGLISDNVALRVKPLQAKESKREYLTIEELQKLVDTDCQPDVLKRAALFSALTGLRFSDIAKLTWSEVAQTQDGGYCLQFRQQKTGGLETLPISEQALNLLGVRGPGKPFAGLVYSTWLNTRLKFWMVDAGITKKATFHAFRHTYATLQITLGTDIYTVSKMLGHRDIATTQIYAKIVDDKKKEAANKITLNFKP